MGEVFKEFPATTSNVIASFSGVDIATGRGVGNYYLFGHSSALGLTTDSSTVSYFGRFFDDNITEFDENFDVSINNDFTVDGLAVFTLMGRDKSGSSPFTRTVTATIIRVRDGTPTTIATLAGNISVPVNGFGTATIEGAITNQRFAKGDTLRLNLVVQAKTTFTEVEFYFDPSNLLNTDAVVLSTQSVLKHPILSVFT